VPLLFEEAAIYPREAYRALPFSLPSLVKQLDKEDQTRLPPVGIQLDVCDQLNQLSGSRRNRRQAARAVDRSHPMKLRRRP
jgi:hypothetical protein